VPPARAETYADIVWKQFRRNLLAYGSLWALGPVVMLAIFSPAIASGDPLIFTDGATRIYPWFRALFTVGEMVDFVFNMAVVAFPVWLVLAVGLTVRWRRRGTAWPQVFFYLAGLWLGLTLVLTGLFGGVKPEPVEWSSGNVKPFLIDKGVLAAPAWLLAILLQLPFWRKAGLTVPARFMVGAVQFLVLLGVLIVRYVVPDFRPGPLIPSSIGRSS
jgi:hypothetical protein